MSKLFVTTSVVLIVAISFAPAASADPCDPAAADFDPAACVGPTVDEVTALVDETVASATEAVNDAITTATETANEAITTATETANSAVENATATATMLVETATLAATNAVATATATATGAQAFATQTATNAQAFATQEAEELVAEVESVDPGQAPGFAKQAVANGIRNSCKKIPNFGPASGTVRDLYDDAPGVAPSFASAALDQSLYTLETHHQWCPANAYNVVSLLP